jgi:hypothetical protein
MFDACQLASGLDKLHTKMSSAPATQESPIGTDPGAAPATSAAGDGGLPASNVTTPNRSDGGGGNVRTDAGATHTNNAADPGAKANSPALDGGVSTGPTPAVDSGLIDPMNAMGTPSMTSQQGMPSSSVDAGTGLPPQAGSMAPLPVSGSGGSGGSPPVEPSAPMCTPPLPGAPCDTAPQCGCAQGENCIYPVTFDFPTCVRAGSVDLNQHCDLTSECKVGLTCLSGACLQLCDPSAQGCANGAACSSVYRLQRPISGLYTCDSDCNLVDPRRQSGALSSCGEDLTCVWFGEGASCAYGGQSGGRHGEVCSDSFDCAMGYSCMDSGTCARWCVSSQDCPSGFSCADTNTTVAGTRFGLCRPSCPDSREISCGVNPQCGCEGAMACDFLERTDQVFVRGCRARGATQAHFACDYDEQCIAGTSCVGLRCSPFCERDADCGGQYARCIQVVDGSADNEPPIPGFQVCRLPCDPADLSRPHGIYEACPSGRGCQPSSDGRSSCFEMNENAERGDSCSYNQDCATGFTCTTEYGCASQCRTNADCRAGYTCRSLATPLYAGAVEWGVCLSTPP